MKRPDAVAYVVARALRPGATRTRLCPPLAPDEASDLARAFLFDTLTNATLAGLTPRIVCRGATEQQKVRQLASPLTQVSSNPVADHALSLAVDARRSSR